MAAADAVGSVAAIAADRRRHSIDVASITFQRLKPNGVSDLQPQSTSAAPSGKRSRNASQGQGRVPANGGVGTAFVDADDASTEGQGKSMQGQGLFRRPYNGLGFITRFSPSGRPMTSLPVTDAQANVVVGTETSSGRHGVTAGARSSSPRPALRRAPAVTSSSDELQRAASYEEELEARLKNVRQRTLDVERRFVTEQFKRRQAMLLAEVLERQHLETVSKLSAESERRIDELKSRCEEVREECRRRIAETENRSSADVGRLETQLQAVQDELSETKQQLERYRNSRVIDPALQRDADTQVNFDDVADHQPETANRLSLRTTQAADEVDATSSSPVKPLGEPIVESEHAWDRFYDVLTSLAFSRVRYLEEQLAAANRHDQQPEVVRGQLRRLKGLRQRAVTGGQPKTSVTASSTDASPSPVLPVQSILNNPQQQQLPADNLESTARTVLHRTSSCPSPEVVVAALGDDRHEETLRSQSAIAHSDEADMTSSLAESGSGSGTTVDLSFSSLPTVSEMSDSVSISLRQSTCSDDDDIPDIPDDSILATSTPAEPRSPVAMTTPPAEDASPRLRSIPKRNSTLSLDIFRKLQASRRRERPSSSGTSSTNRGSDDERSEVVSVGQKESASRKSSNSDMKDVLGQSVVVGVDRASSMLDTSSSSSASDSGRRKAILRHSLPASQRQNSDDSASTLIDETPETTSLNDVANSDAVLSNNKRRSRGNSRPKSSSFGRLHERRNGLVSSTSLPFGMTSSSTGGLLPSQPRVTSQSRLDNLAKNIKHYLTSQ